METLFFPKEQSVIDSRKTSESHILAQRFEGKCSLDAISTLMKRSGMSYSSVGYISQFLSHVGNCLPNTLENKQDSIQLVVFAGDEIFAKSIPLLITVDPISSAILRIELANQRTAAIWSSHFEAIEANGFVARSLTSDAGKGLCASHQAVLSDIPWQLDTFHGIAHRLGDYVRRLEKAAYAAIEATDKREATLTSARSERVIDKRINLWVKADTKAEQNIDLYDDFSYLYTSLIHQLNLFDSNSKLRQRDQVEAHMIAALDLMASLNHPSIAKTALSIKKTLPHLLTYLQDGLVAVENCQKLTDNNDALEALYLAWQWNKAVIKSKVALRKKRAIKQRQLYLELAELFIGEEEKYLILKEKVFNELDHIVQASSMVECINSVLRPYLNTSKNHITQEFLNIFMFYHNHRRYHAGKRKGKTPMEILTGNQQQEDWLALLWKEVEKNDSVLAA